MDASSPSPAAPSSPAPETVSIDAALQRLRAWMQAKGWTPHAFATEAGVSEAATRDMMSPGWAPTVRTLRKLEAVLPPGWPPSFAGASEIPHSEAAPRAKEGGPADAEGASAAASGEQA